MAEKLSRGWDPRVKSTILHGPGLATRPGRPLPGQDSHLLEQRTFARRTWTTTRLYIPSSACPSLFFGV